MRPAEACAPTTVRFEHGTSAFDQRDRPSDRPSEVDGLVRTLRNSLPSGRYSPLHAAGAYQLRRRREARIARDRALR